MFLKKDEKVKYNGPGKYVLSNSQQILSGEEITIISDVNVQDGLFEIIKEEIKLDIDKLHEEALKENEIKNKEKEIVQKKEEEKKPENNNKKDKK